MTPDPTEETRELAGTPPAEVAPATEIDQLAANDGLAAAGAAAERAESRSPAADEDVEALLDTSFPVVFRGYDTRVVDAYVASVERCIDRFQESHLPTDAVRRALDRVGEQTATILQEAERSAEETTATSRAQADDRLQRAEQEAAAISTTAHARARGIDDDIERLWQERQRLIEATKGLAEALSGIAADAEARFPPEDDQASPGETVRGTSRNGTRRDDAAADE
jgi:cell division septum initiation protein DivIVA